jgi:hypothetical protein
MFTIKSMSGAALVMGLMCAGCATYQPPAIPPAEMAHIFGREFGDTHNISRTKILINRIDGVGCARMVEDFNKPYDIAPGKHTLNLLYIQGPFGAGGHVTFLAEAGKTYRVMGYLGEPDTVYVVGAQQVYFFVENEAGENISEQYEEKKKGP